MNIKAYRTTYGDNLEERIFHRQRYKEACRRIRAEMKEVKDKIVVEEEYTKKTKPMEYKLAIGKEWLEIKAKASYMDYCLLIDEIAQKYSVKADCIRKYARMYLKSEICNKNLYEKTV